MEYPTLSKYKSVRRKSRTNSFVNLLRPARSEYERLSFRCFSCEGHPKTESRRIRRDPVLETLRNESHGMTFLRRAIPRFAPNGRPDSINGRGLARLWSAVACYRFRRRGLPRRAVYLASCRAFGLRPLGASRPTAAPFVFVSRSVIFHATFAGRPVVRG